MLRRASYVSMGLLLLIGAPRVSVPGTSGTLTSLVPWSAPQNAAADFDADGLPDVASIQGFSSGARVSVALSGSPEVLTFDADGVSIVAGDVDHDGDVDLVLATPANGVVIWLNNGHGGFTQEQPVASPDVSPLATVTGAANDQPIALGPTVPQVVGSSRGYETAVVKTRVRPPTVRVLVALSDFTSLTLRGPPPLPS